jgi:inosine-uridine nucleoside N-ribohydrolase
MSRFLIDTDTAGDDVTSLLFGLLWPGVALEAITVVAGNVELDLCVRNALLTVERTGRTDVPVHAGAATPLTRPLVTAHYVHGADGMGTLAPDPPSIEPSTVHAVDAICGLADRFPGEVEIIAQAPLTNIALALRKDPELPRKVKHLWIMGGANNFVGNITPTAEFNFYVDPEAAHAVLRGGFETTILPWDVCVHDGILMRDELEPFLELKNPIAEFYFRTQAATWDFMRNTVGVDGMSHPDSLMMAMAIDRSVISESAMYFVDCDYKSEMTRGYSVMDKMGVMNHTIDYGVVVKDLMDVDDATPNAEVVLKADKELFKKMLLDLLTR